MEDLREVELFGMLREIVSCVDYMSDNSSDTGNAIKSCFTSPNVSDSNFEAANIVDTTASMARALNRIADALEMLSDK